MYEIRPETVKTIYNGSECQAAEVPEKANLGRKKDFQLCISLFKEYPIGVCILSVDESKGRR